MVSTTSRLVEILESASARDIEQFLIVIPLTQ